MKSNTNINEIDAKVINHLGLVSAMFNNLEIGELIDSVIPPDERNKLTVGDCVKVLVINGLGYTKKPLYLTAEFFKNKPIDRLIKKGITSKDINDDVLGRALDKLYEENLTLLFSQIAYRVANYLNIDVTKVHGDTSSKVMFGSYEPSENQPEIVKHGYSKDKRPDLKQVMFSLVVSNEGNLPLMGGIIPGNTSDTVHFREVVKTLKENIRLVNKDTIMVFDSKLHTEETVREMLGVKWVTRVPESSNLSKKILRKSLQKKLTELGENYSGVEFKVTHGKVKQRWLVVRSEEAHKSAMHSVPKNVEKEKKAFYARLKKMNTKGFACKSDAEEALEKEIKRLAFHKLSAIEIEETFKNLKAGRPTAHSPKKSIFKLKVTLVEDPKKIENAIKIKSRFIVGTSVIEKRKLTSKELLKTYKDQHKVERGFRHLKNPLCMARAVYLKKQSRIVALGFIMLLGLLIYSAIEYATRRALVENDETIPNQLNKPTQNITARRLFEMFEDVIIITYQNGEILHQKVLNLRDDLKKILRLLGPEYCQMYLVS